MDAPEIVADMCSEDLSLTDIKAICKARGFSVSEAKTANFWKILSSLTRALPRPWRC